MLGSLIGKYKILRLIGEGGMATVYEAEHEMLGTKVAIKTLNPILSANTQIKERFRNEAKLMASLDHPNITKVIDFNEQPHQLSIIMEYLNGEDLNDKIKRNGALSEKDTVEVFSQTLSAFQYAHEKGIVHRDIKPSNIFILQDGRVKILDFGIAKLFGQGNEMTQTGTQMGTPIYMSPEQVKADKSIDHRSDIYSLGVTMYFAINGKPPYNSNTDSQFDIFSKIVYEPLPNLSADSIFNHSIVKACQKDREKRFQSCKEWLESVINDNKINVYPTANPIEEKNDRQNQKGLNANHSTSKPTPEKSNLIKASLIFGIIFGALIIIISIIVLNNHKNNGWYSVNRIINETENFTLSLGLVKVGDENTILSFNLVPKTDTLNAKVAINTMSHIIDNSNNQSLFLSTAIGINYIPNYSYTQKFELVFPRISDDCKFIDFVEDDSDSTSRTWKCYNIDLTR